MYQGSALKKQSVPMVPTFNERLAQAVERSKRDRDRGYAEGYRDAAELARNMGLADYCKEEDANSDLLERACNAFDDERPGCSREWLNGYDYGLKDVREDLSNYEYDAEAEARLVAAGVTL